MLLKWIYIGSCVLTGIFMPALANAQGQKEAENTLDSLRSKKGVIGAIAQTLITDTTREENKILERADLPFQKYNNKIIRNITIQPIDFGIMIGDTSRRFNNTLTDIANFVHCNTRAWVVRNHLFFKENEPLSPFLFGNNERYLRDLPFLQEAHIKVRSIKGNPDSVDVVVYTKDVLSIGGALSVRNSQSGRVEAREDNFMGWGDKMEVETLYDRARNNQFGFGAEYVKRNIIGTFIDGSAGYLNFSPAFNTQKAEEQLGYLKLEKPLVNPYMRWTYSASAAWHSTTNMFNLDSVYHTNLKYKYRIYDAWAGWNLSSKNIGSANEFERMRFLVSARFFDQHFTEKPIEYTNHYYYAYANSRALLGSFSIFKLNYYKTQYIYGFGRKEDVPEGLEASITGGMTIKEGRNRPYFGLSFDRYYLTKKEGHMSYSLAVGGSLYKSSFEDINLIVNIDYFTRLRQLGTKWKQRWFFNASYGRQFNGLMDEPLLMESKYGFDNFKNNYLGGFMRSTIKGESVFFSPWNLFFFKFAPFVFSSATVFQFPSEVSNSNTRLYSAIGGGIRTRNESLIFGTMELRASYFPKKDAFNNTYQLQLNTNIRFKYKQNFIRRPDFVQVN
jgi:hypothetical protein